MKPRERVIAALVREAPDRRPIQISFTPEFASRLLTRVHLAVISLVVSEDGEQNY
jgi:uroporphyrinogen decarboxylase